MRELKAIVVCVTPFIVAALLLFPLLAIMGGGTDPFLWERNDRVFYFICTVCFGWALYKKVAYE
jgi:hypothetical protein